MLMTKKRQYHMTMTQKEAYISNNLQHQSHSLTFFPKKSHFFQLPSFQTNDHTPRFKTVLHRWASSLVPTLWTLENSKLFCLVQNDSDYLNIKLEVLTKNENTDFRLVRNFSMGEAVFNQFMQLRNQLVFAAEHFGRDQTPSTIQITTMSKDIKEQLNLVHKMVDVVDHPCRKVYAPLLRYNKDKPEISYAPVRFLAMKKKDEKFLKNFVVTKKFEKIIHVLDVLNSVCD